ncbi:MAG: hypothetical protein O3A53_16035, partial [Acidobacteria bacterium]|nr:hypothetical protein [Acidobacteriota bacterium]MDA1236294.1 hypothetical protein [Acidobacteriota bacterium]
VCPKTFPSKHVYLYNLQAVKELVLSMIPLCVGIMMFFTNDEYVLFFFDDPDGKIMMAVTIILQLLGFISIRKLTDLGV